MKRLITSSLIVVLALFGVAGATHHFTLDDGGVDYGNEDLDTAYLALNVVDGEFVVVLSDTDTGATLLPIEFDDVVIVEREDIFGDSEPTAWFARRGGSVEVDRTMAGVRSMTVTHDDVSVRAGAAAYEASLTALGFDVSVERSSNGNFATVVAQSAEGTFQVVIHRAGTGVTARIAAIPAA